MTTEEIFNQVSLILKNTFDNNEIDLNHETSANDIDEWDSLSHIELISNIESHFKVRFALGELQDLKNIGEMVELIKTKI
ncbi:MAG: acyl carrier protein [Bacteriovoracaceae bacterium]|jgi:acyl carrier protein|nr:acyl carrier protein [Halobacteriovoraceae bacterium]MDP7321761.1 acyl carrier protein [Bacteriovoracaceae bacterium]|tara:strand:- start:305 stop:544 length:240 start_codon:yes stop_codon:yes gene_type:complete